MGQMPIEPNLYAGTADSAKCRNDIGVSSHLRQLRTIAAAS